MPGPIGSSLLGPGRGCNAPSLVASGSCYHRKHLRTNMKWWNSYRHYHHALSRRASYQPLVLVTLAAFLFFLVPTTSTTQHNPTNLWSIYKKYLNHPLGLTFSTPRPLIPPGPEGGQPAAGDLHGGSVYPARGPGHPCARRWLRRLVPRRKGTQLGSRGPGVGRRLCD